MTCILCNGTLYVQVPGGVAPCTSCDAGIRRVEAAKSHRERYGLQERGKRQPTKQAGWKERQSK